MSNLYLLDTCAWLDAFNFPERLHPNARSLICSQSACFLADISILEVARKAEAGDLILSDCLAQWFESALSPGPIQVLPITSRIAVESVRLPAPFHKDPADRLIVATARIHGLIVITSDQKILEYPHVRSVASR